MNQIQELTLKVQRELYAKLLPGEVLLNIRENWLEKLLETHHCNVEALMLGFMFADFKLQEATDLRKPNDHIRMSLDYARQAFDRYSEISLDDQNIVLEIIETHHGGNHNHIESKLFKNADSLAFLEPKGWFHFFSLNYDNKGDQSFGFAMKKLDEIIEDRYLHVDLNDEVVAEAKLLKEKYEWMKLRMLK